MNLYGIERATADLDLVVYLEEKNIGKFIAVMKELGFKPKVPVKLEDFIREGKRAEWIREKGMVVFSLFDPENPFFCWMFLWNPLLIFPPFIKNGKK